MSTVFSNKLQKTFNKIIMEERKENLKYDEKKTKGVITGLSVYVTGNSANKINRLVQAIESTRDQLDELNAKQKELTGEAKTYSEDFFNESDKIYSRVIETNNSMITFSKIVPKVTQKENRDNKKAEKLINDILSLLIDQQDELSKSIVEMIKACDWIKKYEETTIPAEKVTTKSVVQEGIITFTQDLIKKIKAKFVAVTRKIKKYILTFDNMQKRIDNQINQLSEMSYN